MSQWRNTTLGAEGVRLQHGFTFPSEQLSPEGKLPVIRLGNVQRGDVQIDENVKYTGDLTDDDLSRQSVLPGDVLIALTGGDESQLGSATGRVGRYKSDRPALLNQRVAKIVQSDSTDLDFLFYFLSQESITRFLASTANGSVQKNLTNAHVLNLDIRLPSLMEQRSIAALFRSLDDKIELLRKQNETLEQIAQTVFHEWFVQPITDGNLPSGWRWGVLSDVAAVEWGNTNLTKSSYVPSGGYLGVSAAGCDGRMEHAEHTVGTTVISAIGEYAGRVFYPHEPFTAIKNTLTVSPIEGKSTAGYVHNLLIEHSIPRRGAAQPFLSKGDTENYKIAVPPFSTISRAEEVFSTIEAKVRNSTSAIKTLAVIRDALLPKLMSGRIRI